VIKDTAASFEGTCEKKNINFELTFSDSMQMVYADLGKIQQVLYNLIDNAIKFSHQDSTIYIQTRIKNEKIFVSVKDTGIGIPKDSVQKVFDRFYKSDLSRGKDKKGTGLGLAIVKEIIQAHGESQHRRRGIGVYLFPAPGNESVRVKKENAYEKNREMYCRHVACHGDEPGWSGQRVCGAGSRHGSEC
jgi:signal transduction histidine kinase